MTDPTAADERAFDRYLLNRRRFLTMLGSAGAMGVVGCSPAAPAARVDPEGRAADPADRGPAAGGAEPDNEAAPAARRPPGDPNRNLVVIELQGGNDGLAMLQPYETALLHDRRANLVSLDEDLIDAGSGFGWHPMLAGLANFGVTGVLGIGTERPDFSHFEMEQRWWRGDGSENSRLGSGFFGRLCDQLDVGAPVTGLSLSGGPTAALASDRAVTVGLSDPGANWFLQQDDAWYDMFRRTLRAMAQPSETDSDRFVAARSGLSNTLRFAESLGVISTDGETEYPWTDLGQQLRFAADVLSLDVGVKVLHVQLGGFDTHSGQDWRYPELMQELNDATLFFAEDLRRRNLFDGTLIVTTSEFGRRVEQNDGGTDHGGASTMLLCGPGTSGVHGEAPSLSDLDEGNLRATSRLEDYYATIAYNWFGIDPAVVLPSGGTPIDGII